MSCVNLYCQKTLVARSRYPFCDDETWYGICEISINQEDGSFEEHLLNFIHLSEDWNARMETNPSNPPDISEFNPFNELFPKICGELKQMIRLL